MVRPAFIALHIYSTERLQGEICFPKDILHNQGGVENICCFMTTFKVVLAIRALDYDAMTTFINRKNSGRLLSRCKNLVRRTFAKVKRECIFHPQKRVLMRLIQHAHLQMTQREITRSIIDLILKQPGQAG
jgi:hypothetical protein